MSASWCLVSMYRILNFRIKINPVKQPIQSNSVGSWYMSHCGTSAFDDHLDHSFIVFEHIQYSIGTRMCSAWWNMINVGQIRIGVRGWNLCSHVRSKICRQVFPWLSDVFGFVGLACCGMQFFNHKIPEIESGNPINASTCIERNHLSFRRTVWNWTLFPAHST